MIEVIRTLQRESEYTEKFGRWIGLVKFSSLSCVAALIIASFVLDASLKDNSGYDLAMFILWSAIMGEYWVSWGQRRISAIAASVHQALRTASEESEDPEPGPRLRRRRIRDDLEVREGRIQSPNEHLHYPEPREKKPIITRFMRKLRIRPDEQI